MKTIEQEAKELVDRYLEFTPAEEEFEYPYAKKCAAIDVQNTIDALNKVTPKVQIIWHYQQLKAAIKKV